MEQYQKKFLAIFWDTRNGRVCKTNIRICAVGRVQGYIGIRANKPYNVKFSEKRGEQTCVKQLVSLKETRNHPSKISMQGRLDDSGIVCRGSMIECDMVGMSSGFYCTHPLNLRWWNIFAVLNVNEVLIISFVEKILAWSILKVDDN